MAIVAASSVRLSLLRVSQRSHNCAVSVTVTVSQWTHRHVRAELATVSHTGHPAPDPLPGLTCCPGWSWRKGAGFRQRPRSDWPGSWARHHGHPKVGCKEQKLGQDSECEESLCWWFLYWAIFSTAWPCWTDCCCFSYGLTLHSTALAWRAKRWGVFKETRQFFCQCSLLQQQQQQEQQIKWK